MKEFMKLSPESVGYIILWRKLGRINEGLKYGVFCIL